MQQQQPAADFESGSTSSVIRTRSELRQLYVERARAQAAGQASAESPWANARQLGVKYGPGIGLYLQLTVW